MVAFDCQSLPVTKQTLQALEDWMVSFVTHKAVQLGIVDMISFDGLVAGERVYARTAVDKFRMERIIIRVTGGVLALWHSS